LTDNWFLMSTEKLELIHRDAVRILAEIGIKTGHGAMRESLAALGGRVEGERVLFPEDMVAAALKRLPDSFTLFGRSTERKETVDLNHTLCTNTGILPNIYDFETGEIRRSTLKDVETTTRLLDAMDNVPVIYVSLVDATELEPHMVTASDFAATLRNTTKPLLGPGLTNRAEAETIIAMARAVRDGDAGLLRKYPICAPFICPITPLQFPDGIVDALIVIAEAGLPLDVVTNPVMGLTSPYTIASTVALGHAETLACAVMADAVTPGLPILNQNTPSVADMRTLASTTGGPETGLIRRTVIELSHHLQIPGCAHGHTSSAKIDYQAADEKALNTLVIASARPSILGGLGALANVTLTAYETIVLDNERYGAILRLLDGVQVDQDHLGFQVIADMVLSGDVLTHPHTSQHLRSGEVFDPRLADRRGLVSGKAEPATSVDRARDVARRLIETYEVEPLEAAVDGEISEILRRHGMA
jgi:trimethylamine--corrinoid protein Co-methyltransferase